MNEKTTGQLACIAWNAAFGEQFGIIAADEWGAGDPRGHAAWEAAATAAQQPLREELDQLQEQLGRLQDSIGNLAAGLKLSADASRPSKKSQIEDGVAAALLGILDPRQAVERVKVDRHLL